MKRLKLKYGLATGTVIVLGLVACTTWAQKNSAKIDVKTAAPSVQNVSQAQPTDFSDPFRNLMAMQDEISRFFGQPFAAFRELPPLAEELDGAFARPDMDLREVADAYHVRMDLPGMDKSGITVELKDNILTVKAERKQEIGHKDDDGKMLIQERSSGFMSRSVMLSKPVDAAKVTAQYKDGVLQITLPKVQSDPAPQQIQIK